MKRLIVNADDLGLTEGVNRAIFEAHQHGIVTSASLLANGAAFASAAEALPREALASKVPRLSVGVHLNLSQGPPAATAAAVATLLDAAGELHLTPGRLELAIASGQAHLDEIETELRAQIRRVIAVGIAPSHLDGHMHVHVLPGVAEITVKLAREFGIAAVRCPVEPPGRLLRPGGSRWVIALGVSMLGRRLRRLADRAGVAHPARFYGIRETGVLDARGIERILRALPPGGGASELMCHPGYGDAALSDAGGELQAAQRETEVRALTSPEIAALVAAEGISLASYRELAESDAPMA